VKRSLLKLAAMALFCTLFCSNLARAQILPPAKQAAHVAMVKGPSLEMAIGYMAIVRWTTTNPGGGDEHFAIAHYGTDPGDLSETAKSHIRLNRNHPNTIFRVRLLGLKPDTTYYYWVTSMGADGREDGVKSAVCKFTTPGPGNRIINFPQPK
jgi:Purple acid Phosphatase, N-terminal domain